MRFVSSASKSEISRKVSTWRSGRTRTCTGALGLMSLIATKPSARCRCSPSRTSMQKRQSSGGGNDPVLGHRGGADAHELPDRCIDEPRRVVVPVASPGAVDEHDVVHLAPPSSQAELV